MHFTEHEGSTNSLQACRFQDEIEYIRTLQLVARGQGKFTSEHSSDNELQRGPSARLLGIAHMAGDAAAPPSARGVVRTMELGCAAEDMASDSEQREAAARKVVSEEVPGQNCEQPGAAVTPTPSTQETVPLLAVCTDTPRQHWLQLAPPAPRVDKASPVLPSSSLARAKAHGRRVPKQHAVGTRPGKKPMPQKSLKYSAARFAARSASKDTPQLENALLAEEATGPECFAIYTPSAGSHSELPLRERSTQRDAEHRLQDRPGLGGPHPQLGNLHLV